MTLASRRPDLARARLVYLALGASLLLTAAPAHAAAGRSLAFVESCRTTPHRHVDVEFWGQTYGNADYNLQAVGGRIGYGVTARLDLSVELEFDQGFSDQPVAGYGSGGYILAPGLAFARLNARYRLSDPGRWPMDVLLEVSLGPATQVPKGFVVDDRIVLQRRFGPVTLLLDGATRAFFSKSEGGAALGFTAGVRYAPFHAVRLGVEGGLFAFVPPVDYQPTYGYLGASLRVGTDRLWGKLYYGLGPMLSINLGWTM